jgi:tetratricopeptide (TPR) repeat protein
MPMRRALPMLLLLGLAGVARADLAAGDVKLRHGDHAGALAEYKAAKGDLAAVRAAEVLRATGRYAEARAALEALAKKDPTNYRARVQLGLVYRETGETRLASQIWNKIFDDHEAGKIDESRADNLMYLALAARYLEDFQGANDTFRDAVGKDGKLLEANLEWGWLFLDKYDAADAETSFTEVLKIDPTNPEAHAGMARVKIEQNYDYKGAFAEVDKALAENPHLASALLIRAELQLDNDEYDATAKTLAQVLATNPNDVTAHAMLATIAFLRDDSAAYEAEKKKAFAVNPKDAPFYHVVGDYAVKEHRYKEAIALENEAIKIDPKYWTALAAVGAGYLRMGDETNGLKALSTAADGDKFNVRTYNLLNLFEDVIPKKYETFNAPPVFRFRVPKEERAELERYLPRMLDAAWADMVKRYGFTPTMPVTVELFNDPDQYSVRTVGLPNFGALAVCFGQVITALAPSNGNLNWGNILWHELGHVFAIQLSNGRVPRWFTEGLSEYETLVARPEWRRENDVDIWQAYAHGTLPSVLELNARVLRAKDMSDMVVAYHMSSVTVEFIARRFGFPKIVEALKMYGKGKDTAEILPAITGLSIPEFDREFRKYLDERLAPYRGTFRVNLAMYDDGVTIEKAAAARPGDADAQADLALSKMQDGDGEKAAVAVQTALKLDPKNKKALFADAELKLAHGDAAGGKASLEALIAAGGDGYDARIRLAKLAVQAGDMADAEKQVLKAKQLDPERSEPYAVIGEAYFKHNREDDALHELEQYVMIEQMDYAPVKKLVTKLYGRKDWAKVRKYGEMALYINPEDPDLHVQVAEAHAQTGDPDGAIFEYQSALVADPPLSRPAVAQIGLAGAYLAKKDVANARKAIAEALKLEPDNADAKALSAKIK